MSRHERLRILDILDAIDRTISYVEGMNYDDFLADRKTQDAVTRNIEIIGEAARTLPEVVGCVSRTIFDSRQRLSSASYAPYLLDLDCVYRFADTSGKVGT